MVDYLNNSYPSSIVFFFGRFNYLYVIIMSRLSYWSRFKWSRAINASAIPTDFGNHPIVDVLPLKHHKPLWIQDVSSDDIIKATPWEAKKRSDAIVDFWIYHKKRSSLPNPFDKFLS